MPSLLPGLKHSSSKRPVSGLDQDSTDTAPFPAPDDDQDTVDGEQVTAAKPDNQTLLRLLEDGEQVSEVGTRLTLRCTSIVFYYLSRTNVPGESL